MKRKVGYPASVKVLTRFGYNPRKVLQRDFGFFGYIERTPQGNVHRWHKPLLGQIAYLVRVYEKYHNYH